MSQNNLLMISDLNVQLVYSLCFAHGRTGLIRFVWLNWQVLLAPVGKIPLEQRDIHQLYCVVHDFVFHVPNAELSERALKQLLFWTNNLAV